ncbi:hypothetical protein RND81_13G014900 [Saponaria officinalis]|uniref:AT-hook motif nuclear-localized protein n=1 Tax=Saponaria officinalis TaxID=3572 RepID=A0AAW1GZC9_SAPOF
MDHHHNHHNHHDPQHHHHHIRHQQHQHHHLHHQQQQPQHHPHHHQHHHQQQQQHHPSQPMYPHMISMPNYTTNNRFPFNSSPPHTVAPTLSKPIQPLEPLTSPYSASGGGGSGGGGYDIDPNSQKKKRGRPRKYSPDNGGGGGGGGGGSGIALGLSPTPLSSGGGGDGGGGGGGGADSSGATPSSENSSRKNRGRPPSSSKKQLDALGNCGVGFTPHVILVNAGEDIASKIIDFSKQGERTICVLSANGSISNVDLRQPAMSGGVVKYEGQFEIISLSGSFLFSQNSGGQVRSGGLSVSLADSDGRVLGGGVVGVLRAATHVQIIVGSFIADGKKPKYMPSVPPSHMLSFSEAQPGADTSPPSQEVSTEGSDENGSNHMDRNTGSHVNSNHPMHHNMQMYSQMNWPNPGSKMLQN